MQSAWEMLRSLYNDFTVKELEEIFGVCTVAGIVNTYTEERVRERLQQREKAKIPVPCVCGEIPDVVCEDGHWHVRCASCGMCTPGTEREETAVYLWSMLVQNRKRVCDGT